MVQGTPSADSSVASLLIASGTVSYPLLRMRRVGQYRLRVAEGGISPSTCLLAAFSTASSNADSVIEYFPRLSISLLAALVNGIHPLPNVKAGCTIVAALIFALVVAHSAYSVWLWTRGVGSIVDSARLHVLFSALEVVVAIAVFPSLNEGIRFAGLQVVGGLGVVAYCFWVVGAIAAATPLVAEWGRYWILDAQLFPRVALPSKGQRSPNKAVALARRLSPATIPKQQFEKPRTKWMKRAQQALEMPVQSPLLSVEAPTVSPLVALMEERIQNDGATFPLGPTYSASDGFRPSRSLDAYASHSRRSRRGSAFTALLALQAQLAAAPQTIDPRVL